MVNNTKQIIKHLKTLVMLVVLIIVSFSDIEAKKKQRLTNFNNEQINKILPDFFNYCKKAQKDWMIPGMAVIIVTKDGKIHIQCFGKRNINKPYLIDKNTLFQVASITKPITAALCGILEKEKVFNLSDKIVKYYKDFYLKDENTTKNATLDDLIGHRIGLAGFAGDSFYKAGLSKEQIFNNLRHLDTESIYKEELAYSNVMFGLMGEIIEIVTKENYNNILVEKLFRQLKMLNSSAGNGVIKDYLSIINKIKQAFGFGFNNISYNHDVDQDGNIVPVDFIKDDLLYVFNGTSDVNTTPLDFANFMLCMLNDGNFNNKQIIPLKHYEKMLTPVAKMINQNQEMFSHLFLQEYFTRPNYGLGLYVIDFKHNNKKLKMYGHIGGYTSQRTNFWFNKEHGFAIAIFTNLGNFQHNMLPEALLTVFLQMYLGGSYKDTSTQTLKNKQKIRSQNKNRRLQNKLINPKAPQELSAYEGIYINQIYDKLEIRQKKDYLNLTLNNKSARLKHYNGDIFQLSESFTNNSSLDDWTYIQFGTRDNKNVAYFSICSEAENIFTKIN